MILASLNHLLKLLSGDQPAPQDRQAIVNETVLLVLARATDSDANIKHIEVETVQRIIHKITGETVSAADVRVAAHSKIYEQAPLDRHLARVRQQIDLTDRVTIAKALAEVLLSDDRVTAKETRFFDMVADALALTPAALAGLLPTE